MRKTRFPTVPPYPRARLGLAMVVCALFGCSSQDRLAGNGSSSETVIGRVLDGDGRPVANARVSLHSHRMNPAEGDVSQGLRARTDTDGRYRIGNVPSGKYNLEGLSEPDGRRFLVRNLEIGVSAGLDLRQDTLALPARIRIPFPGPDPALWYAYLPGTTVLSRLEDAGSPGYFLVLDSVPAAPDHEIFLARAGDSALLYQAYANIAVEAGDTLTLPPSPSFRPLARRLFVHPEAAGVAPQEAIPGFPLLVRLTPDRFDFAQSPGRGRNLRFTNAAGDRELAHEIEAWDSAGGSAAVWVRLDTLGRNGEGRMLRMFWGGDSRADVPGQAVFRAAEGYVGVWHLGDPGAGPRRNAADSLLPARPGGYRGDEAVRGLIGACDSLDPDDHDTLGVINLPGAFTLSVWVNLDQAVENARIIAKAWSVPEDPFVSYALWYGTISPPRPGGRVSRADGTLLSVGYRDSSLVPGQWTHLALACDGTRCRFYFNGALVQEVEGNTVPAPNSRETFLAWNEAHAPQKFIGKVDELRICRVGRKADWIRLSYENQRRDGRLVEFR